MTWFHLLKLDLQSPVKHTKPNMDKSLAMRNTEIWYCLRWVQVHAGGRERLVTLQNGLFLQDRLTPPHPSQLCSPQLHSTVGDITESNLSAICLVTGPRGGCYRPMGPRHCWCSPDFRACVGFSLCPVSHVHGFVPTSKPREPAATSLQAPAQ